MSFNPRIGPLSSVGNIKVSPQYITGNSTGYCSFPVLGPPEELGPPSEGPTCPTDKTQQFTGIRSGGGGAGTTECYMYELSGVNVVPSVTSTKDLQGGLVFPLNTGPLTPGNSYFAAILIESFIARVNFPGQAIAAGSPNLTFDLNGLIDAAANPLVVAGHRFFSFPNGAYDTTIVYSTGIVGWAESSVIFVSNGQQPTIDQKVAAGTFGSIATLVLPSNPHAGNVLVAVVYTRDKYASISAPTGAWSTTGLLTTGTKAPDFDQSSMQMFWKTVCT